MRSMRGAIKYTLLATLVLTGVGISSFGGFVQEAIAAPVDSIRFTNSIGTADCKPQLALGNGGYIPDQVLISMEASPSQSVKDDAAAIRAKRSNGESIIYISFVPLNAGGNGTNASICEEANMVSRPSSPKAFMGVFGNSTNLSNATLDATAKTLGFVAASGAGALVINVTNDPSSGDVLANPVFGATGGQAGFCSDVIGGPDGQGKVACMQVHVQDFNTMTYRGETYTLAEWRGDDLVYRISSTPYDARKFFLNQANTCKPRLTIGEGNDHSNGDTYDLNVDNDEKGEFAQVLSTLSSLPGTGKIGYIDYDSTCTEIPQIDVSAFDFTNLRVMFQVFPKEKKIAFITNNPSGNEKKFITGAFVQDATNTLRYNAPGRTADCSTGDVVPHIILDAQPVETEGASPVSGTWYFQTDSNGCGPGDIKSTIVLAKQTSSTSTDTTTTVGEAAGVVDSTATDTADTKAPITCNTTWKNAISWILCPVIAMAENLVDSAEELIASFLFIDTTVFDGNSAEGNTGGLYAAWNSIRQISTIIIVIIALIMIMSEAMGAGIMNNYAVKKILPRLIFAGIAIQLSWVFTKELINISNVFGNGIQGLMLAPFGGKVNTNLLSLIDTEKLSGGSTAGLSLALLVGGGVAIGAVGSIAIGLIIALIVAFVTLILRYMVIIMAVLFSPIAIAMSVLPGTQKSYKWWWESFSKALLMYPIIMAMFAMGKIIAFGLMKAGTETVATGADQNSQKGWFVLAAIVAYFMPYAFLPAALKAGGAALNKVTGAFNDKSKGVFDKAKTWNDTRDKAKKARSQRNAFDPNHKSWYAKGPGKYVGGGLLNKGLKAKTRAGVYVGSGNVGFSKDQRVERGKLAVKSAQEAANTRLFDKESALKEVAATEAKTAVSRANINLSSMNGQMVLKMPDGQSVQVKDKSGKVVAFNYNDADHMRQIAEQSGHVPTVKAAISQIVAAGSDGDIRKLQVAPTNSTVGKALSEATLEPGFYGAFKDKAPDIAKGSADAGFGTLPVAAKMHDWTADTLDLALKHDGGKHLGSIVGLAQSDPDFAASLDEKKKRVLETAAGGPITYAQKVTK